MRVNGEGEGCQYMGVESEGEVNGKEPVEGDVAEGIWRSWTTEHSSMH